MGSEVVRQRSFDAKSIPVESLGDAKLVRLLAYWDTRRYGHAMPLRRDLLPEEMRYLLGRIALFDVRSGGADFRFRLVGTALTQILETDLTGRSLASLRPAPYRALMGDLLTAAARSEAPTCQEIIMRQQRQSFAFKALVLPVAATTPDSLDILMMACNWSQDQVPLVDPLGQRFA